MMYTKDCSKEVTVQQDHGPNLFVTSCMEAGAYRREAQRNLWLGTAGKNLCGNCYTQLIEPITSLSVSKTTVF